MAVLQATAVFYDEVHAFPLAPISRYRAPKHPECPKPGPNQRAPSTMVFGEVARMDRPKMKIAEFDGESISGLCFHQNYREPLGKSDSSSFSLSTHPHSPTGGLQR